MPVYISLGALVSCLTIALIVDTLNCVEIVWKCHNIHQLV